MTGVFEYGQCLKAFPDEEIKLIVRETAQTQVLQFFKPHVFLQVISATQSQT